MPLTRPGPPPGTRLVLLKALADPPVQPGAQPLRWGVGTLLTVREAGREWWWVHDDVYQHRGVLPSWVDVLG